MLVWGEFGRTPKIIDMEGRDHWPDAGFALFAGGGAARARSSARPTAAASGPGPAPLGRRTCSARSTTPWASTRRRSCPTSPAGRRSCSTTASRSRSWSDRTTRGRRDGRNGASPSYAPPSQVTALADFSIARPGADGPPRLPLPREDGTARSPLPPGDRRRRPAGRSSSSVAATSTGRFLARRLARSLPRRPGGPRPARGRAEIEADAACAASRSGIAQTAATFRESTPRPPRR